MATTTKTRKTLPAVAPDVDLIQPAIYPCTLIPDGVPGIVRINKTVYLLQPVAGWTGDELEIAGYRFIKNDQDTHDVEITKFGLECSCGDGVFRVRADGNCKHRKAVKILRERGELV